MRVIPIPMIPDLNRIAFVGDMLSLWSSEYCNAEHILRAREDPTELFSVSGYRSRPVGHFLDPHTTMIKGGKRLNLRGLNMAFAKTKLTYPFATKKMFAASTADRSCDATYYQRCSSKVVMYRGTWRLLDHGLVIHPVLYRGSRGAVYYTSVLESHASKRPRTVPLRDVTHKFTPRWLQLNHGRLFCCHVASESGACQQIFTDPIGCEAISVIHRGDTKPTPIYITEAGIYDFAVSPDGQLLVVCEGPAYGQSIRLFELNSVGLVRSERACFSVPAMRCCFAPDGLTFALYDFRQIRIIDVE